ncbi:hypothetical protein NP233_g9796 [Leucocoprinus birnbaumii]|uniref:DUF6699 domain-containing protein n=1 Tax=Leucocoprinus birnbaumii TaxID=56174 RepID=A0AAD5VJJ6_9AGAR|nr:hypothetical protein NP233_g9796 [Leucocoprinus birnbaumii]
MSVSDRLYHGLGRTPIRRPQSPSYQTPGPAQAIPMSRSRHWESPASQPALIWGNPTSVAPAPDFTPAYDLDPLPIFPPQQSYGPTRDPPNIPTGTYSLSNGIRTILLYDSPNLIVFDLSSAKFGPMRFMHSQDEKESSTLEYLPVEELGVPAVHPPTTALDITCGPDQSWCIELRLVDTHRLVGRMPLPITVGDVLVRIFQFMLQPMQEKDWEKIPEERREQIHEAYETRCRTIGLRGEAEREIGPKRIDYYCGDVWFAGLDRPPGSVVAGQVQKVKLSMWPGDKRFTF